MQEYQRRVLEEKDELDLKLAKLTKFLDEGDLRAISGVNIQLLSEQRQVMEKYSDILARRIEGFADVV